MTGGHAATTAIATIEEVIRRERNWEIYWVGVKGAFAGRRKIPTLESSAIPAKGVVFRSIFAGRIQKKFTKWTIPSMLKIPIGFFHGLYLLATIRPKLVLSFGGFAAYPVVVAAWILRIPVIIHEQTSVVGRANRFSSFFAKKIAISRVSSARFFPKEKVVLTGNPLMTQIWEVPTKKSPGVPLTLFFTGGSRGSRSLNLLMEGALETLLPKYIVIHQAGYLDFSRYQKIKEMLPESLSANYELYPLLDPMQMDGVYRRADIIIARAGANTVAEIMAVKRPSILIPISLTAYDEQKKNAESAVKFGIAEVLDENTAKSDDLVRLIEKISHDWKDIVSKIINKASGDMGAQKKLVDLIEQCLK